MAITGLIFDFDGLMIDTEIPRAVTWKQIFENNGFTLSMEDYYKTIGSDDSAYDPADDLSKRTQNKLSKQEISAWVEEKSQQMIFEQPLLPGVEDIIHKAHDSGMKLGIASSSFRDWVIPLLEKHHIQQYFDVVFTRENVKFTKPDPELYLSAMKAMGLLPNTSIAFEDSSNGIKAAKAAGMYCIAVPNEITRKMNLQIADKIVDSFNDLSIAELINFGN